jgi:hypothetical protein
MPGQGPSKELLFQEVETGHGGERLRPAHRFGERLELDIPEPDKPYPQALLACDDFARWPSVRSGIPKNDIADDVVVGDGV